MNLIVMRQNGQQEIIALSNPAVVERSENSPLWLIRCDGLDHYFSLDGHYDGWGMNVEGQQLSQAEAKIVIEAIETARVIQ